MGGEEDVRSPLVGGMEAHGPAPPQFSDPPLSNPPLQPYPPQPYAPQPYPYQQGQSYAPPYPGQPNPQPGYQQPIGAPMGAPYTLPTVVMAQNIRFRETPVLCTCTFCGYNGPTRVELINGTLTWLSAGAICLFGCWLGCCLIPFAIDGCKDVEHYCGSCQRVVGVFRRIQ